MHGLVKTRVNRCVPRAYGCNHVYGFRQLLLGRKIIIVEK